MAVALPSPVVVADDGARLDDGDQDLLPVEAEAALSPAATSGTTPFAAKGKPCPVAMWGCLECPNAVFTTQHLPQVLVILSFFSSQGWESWDAGHRPEIPERMPMLIDDDLLLEDGLGEPRPTVAVNQWLRELPASGAHSLGTSVPPSRRGPGDAVVLPRSSALPDGN